MSLSFHNLFFLTLYQFQLVYTYIGGKHTIIDLRFTFFKLVNTTNGLAILHAHPVVYPKHRSWLALLFLDGLFLGYLFFLPPDLYFFLNFLCHFRFFRAFCLGLIGTFFLTFAILCFYNAQKFRYQRPFLIILKILVRRNIYLVSKLNHPLIMVIQFLVVLQFRFDLGI